MTTMDPATREALRRYLDRVGYRAAVRAIGVGDTTLTRAVRGRTVVRHATVVAIRAALAVAQEPRP
jgi:hypothetical protein